VVPDELDQTNAASFLRYVGNFPFLKRLESHIVHHVSVLWQSICRGESFDHDLSVLRLAIMASGFIRMQSTVQYEHVHACSEESLALWCSRFEHPGELPVAEINLSTMTLESFFERVQAIRRQVDQLCAECFPLAFGPVFVNMARKALGNVLVDAIERFSLVDAMILSNRVPETVQEFIGVDK
jgi:hypothetical protein